jgi:hypothetical protein
LIVLKSRQQASKQASKKERKKIAATYISRRETKPKPLPKKRERNPTRERDPSSLQTANCLV